MTKQEIMNGIRDHVLTYADETEAGIAVVCVGVALMKHIDGREKTAHCLRRLAQKIEGDGEVLQ